MAEVVTSEVPELVVEAPKPPVKKATKKTAGRVQKGPEGLVLPTLSREIGGRNRPATKRVQILLNLWRISVPTTGLFDPQTERAVEEMQATVGLPVTGVVDQRTWKALLLDSRV